MKSNFAKGLKNNSRFLFYHQGKATCHYYLHVLRVLFLFCFVLFCFVCFIIIIICTYFFFNLICNLYNVNSFVFKFLTYFYNFMQVFAIH